MAALEPELDVAVAAMTAAKARFVVVGGFSVIGFKRFADRPEIGMTCSGSRKSTASCRSSRFPGSTAEAPQTPLYIIAPLLYATPGFARGRHWREDQWPRVHQQIAQF
jgi:hypothetical protein